MGQFNRNFGSRGGFGGRGGGGRFSGNRGERPEMHQATCSECGKECEIPFRPRGDRPVFCSSCFKSQGGGRQERGGDRFERRDDRRSSFFDDEKQMTEVVCDTCGKECEVPFKPTKGKPIYCNECFGKGGKDSAPSFKNVDQYKEQFANLNAKLDKILKILNPIALEKEIKAPVQTPLMASQNKIDSKKKESKPSNVGTILESSKSKDKKESKPVEKKKKAKKSK